MVDERRDFQAIRETGPGACGDTRGGGQGRRESQRMGTGEAKKKSCLAQLDIEHLFTVRTVPYCAWEQGSGSTGIQQGALYLPGQHPCNCSSE